MKIDELMEVEAYSVAFEEERFAAAAAEKKETEVNNVVVRC